MVQDRELFSTEDYYKVAHRLLKKLKYLILGDPEGSRSLTITLDVEYLANCANCSCQRQFDMNSHMGSTKMIQYSTSGHRERS